MLFESAHILNRFFVVDSKKKGWEMSKRVLRPIAMLLLLLLLLLLLHPAADGVNGDGDGVGYDSDVVV